MGSCFQKSEVHSHPPPKIQYSKQQRKKVQSQITADHRAGNGLEVAYFAGGCFWGIEHTFQIAPGVITADSGYQQGRVVNPTYRQVCGKDTGHAETVRVVFDPKQITYRQLLQGFFKMHDPTQVDRQGPDRGPQYRSGIWCVNEEQLKEAKDFIAEQQSQFSKPIATQVEMAKRFYMAEDYHQDYVEETGQLCHGGNPWPKILTPK